MKAEKQIEVPKKNKSKIDYYGLLQTYKFLLIIPFLLLFLFYQPTEGSFLHNLLDKLKFCLGTIIWASLGILVGGLLLTLFKNKGQIKVN